mgnify:CR=1 FL=1
MQNIKSKIIKIESFQEEDRGTTIRVKKGNVISGYFTEWPTIGERFAIYEKIDNSEFGWPIYTTRVVEIIDDRTFKTKNSIYKLITINDERDEKIKTIIE